MSPILIALGFLGSAGVVIAAGVTLARNGDVIAARTTLGGLWVGSIFLAVATSLPELTTDIAAIRLGVPDLAAGDLFGSSMANMLILAIVGLGPGAELFRRAALDNTLSAALAIILTTVAAIALLVPPTISIFGIGPGSLVIAIVYLVGNRAIFRHSAVARRAGRVVELGRAPDGASVSQDTGEMPTLRWAVLAFAAAAVVILLVAPFFATFAKEVADATGLGESFVGTLLVGLSTSLPELVTSLAAVRMGAPDLAVGNLFGSNALNMVMFLPLDLAHRPGPILGMVHPVHSVSALIAVVLMATGLAAIVYQSKGKLSILEPSSGLIMLGYLVGIVLVYTISGAP